MCANCRADTDVAFGKQAGMHTAGVLTGVTTLKQFEQNAHIQPDWVFDNLESVASLC